MKRRTPYFRKHTSPAALLVRALAAVLALLLAFTVGFQSYLHSYFKQQCREQVINKLYNLAKSIEERKAEYERPEDLISYLRIKLSYPQFYQVCPPGSDEPLIESGYSPDCHSCAVLVDRDGEIVASNHLKLITSISFGIVEDTGYLVCDNRDLRLPELDQLFETYIRENSLQTEERKTVVTVEMASAYVNQEKHSFIPHGIVLKRSTGNRDAWNSAGFYDDLEQEEFPMEIDAEVPDYPLIFFRKDHSFSPFGKDMYPFSTTVQFLGESSEVLEKFQRVSPFSFFASTPESYSELEDGPAVFERNAEIFIDDQPYRLSVRLMINYKDPAMIRYFWKWTLLFAGALALLALLWCWWKHAQNKAKYAMEDFQRNLTDSLAHDIKTPLMVISGYTENILNGKLSASEQTEYLHAILDNVFFSDSLISRTLYYNHMDESEFQKTQLIQATDLAEELFSKYALMLQEKEISYTVSGNAEIRASRAALRMILENLISNCVKYTPKSGAIHVELNQKHFTVTNTVAEKIDTRKLKAPFIRGDTARSNLGGHGLGLAIADRTARANGFKLILSCTDTAFKAELSRNRRKTF